MTLKELTQKYDLVFDYTINHRLKEALDILDLLAALCSHKDFTNQLEMHKETYRNMLRYSFELSDDPKKEEVYNRLVKAILDLSDDIREDIIVKGSLLYYTAEKSRLTALKKQFGSSPGDHSGKLQDLFHMIWLTDKFQDAEIKLVKSIIEPGMMPWYEKSLLVSGLFLSLLRHFDVKKVDILFDFYDHKEEQVWERALISLILGLYFHDRRLPYYSEIVSRLKILADSGKLEKSIEALVIQFLKARETEKVTKKIREEILPEMMKIKSTLEEKLDLEEILSASNLEDKNPEWETVFKDTPDLYSKIEEFSTLQMEGADVFLSAFAMLKRFPFFDRFTNWFIPFYKENEDVEQALSQEKNDFNVSFFAEGLESSSILCNSDKYSFCLNVKHMPDEQKSMMMELFNMEMKAMNEMMESDNLIDNTIREKALYTQYLQDLYRFFKLHPRKNDFADIFEMEFEFENSNLFRLLIEDDKILRNIGEFYFEKDYYKQAIDIFEQLGTREDNVELYEKTGYSYQKTGYYVRALEYYRKAELFGAVKPWTLKKIAWCSKKMGDYDTALAYYLEAEKQEPENLIIKTNLGNTHMEKGQFEEALKYYFKVEYLAPKNHKIHRPIAWCSFVLGKFENAKKYFLKVIEKEGNRNDFLNLGHVLWCTGNREEAIRQYRRSIELAEINVDWFDSVLKEDAGHLTGHGIKAFDIPLMVDYMRMNF